jgi:hypothetical protein
MSGQGSGGGGALVLLLVFWVVAVFIVVGPLRDEPADAVADESVEPTPTPDLTFGIACETSTDCEAPVTRAETAGAIDVALDLQPTTDNPFVDDDDNENESAINRVAAAGLMSGCTDIQFCPDDGTTRAQVAAILVRAFGVTPGGPNAFDDDDGNIFEAEINAIAAAGFSGGCGERLFCPDRAVSRQALRDLLGRIVTFIPDPSPSASAAP